MLETANSFLEYRREQERNIRTQGLNSQALPGLLTIEVNITELCNRTCSFCPRTNPDIYPNNNLMIPPAVINRIVSEIRRLRYFGKISFSGFGEPTLNKQFVAILKNFRSASSDIILETNTNGDFLTSALLNQFWEAGLDSLYWNLYDGPEQQESILRIIAGSRFPPDRIRLRPHWKGCDLEKEAGLILNNRSGAVIVGLKRKQAVQGCNYPFYKMLIDWNGNILCCSNDWLRKNIMGNIMSTPLDEIWISKKWHEFRINLERGRRDLNIPCNTCDVNGVLFGDASVEEYFSSVRQA